MRWLALIGSEKPLPISSTTQMSVLRGLWS